MRWLAGLVVPVLLAACLGADGARNGGASLLADDVGRLYPTPVTKVVPGTDTATLVAVVKEAAANGLKVAIAGKGHSQGGHTFYRDAVVLDMRPFNRIISLDVEQKLIRVQSGATWEDVQNYINPHGLAVKVMQSSNIFTLGGSLSANVHGRDPRYGPLIETVRSFTLLRADGSITAVSRQSDAELFSLVIGGYGLFGVILDVELELTDNVSYRKRTDALDYTAYPAWFADNVLNNPQAGLHIARLSIVPGAQLLREMYASTWFDTAEQGEVALTSTATDNRIAKIFYGLSRHNTWGKRLRWALQKRLVDKPGATELVTRNNAMRPPAAFLAYDSPDDTDILQEYFIPYAGFVAFTDRLRDIVIAHDINLLSITIRYLPEDTESVLRYATLDMFAFVLDINHGLDAAAVAEAETWTRELVEAALANGGTYYLTYQLYPASQQLARAYPRSGEFFAKKAGYDPDLLFMNRFYENYASAATE
jgi:FAD/FMN-containing dehydrogenase